MDSILAEELNTKEFGNKMHNVQIKASTIGICPCKLHKSTWSAWPILVSLLNLPPCLIKKNFFTIMALFILVKKEVPSEFFDVWMRPLIDELQRLWEGVSTYDILELERKSNT